MVISIISNTLVLIQNSNYEKTYTQLASKKTIELTGTIISNKEEKTYYNKYKIETKIKNKKPFHLYLYSELLYNMTSILSKIIRKSQFNKLNISNIKAYYNVYGKEATLNHFKLSEKVLKEILNN